MPKPLDGNDIAQYFAHIEALKRFFRRIDSISTVQRHAARRTDVGRKAKIPAAY